MPSNNLAHIHWVCRLCLGFVFAFHGLAPKIILLSATEIALVEAAGMGLPAAVLSPIAGSLEVLLGVSIIFWRKSMLPIYIAAAALASLLVYCALVWPLLLMEAFNPLTTNIMGLVLCYLCIKTNSTRNHIIN